MKFGQEVRAALILALPMAGAQLAQVSLHIIDTLMCGRLGPLALAGVGLGGAAMAMVLLPLLGVMNAVSPLVSQAYGAGDLPRAHQSLRQALILAFLLALPGILLLTWAPTLLGWMGQPPEAVEVAAAYLQAARWSLLPALLFGALRYFMDSLSRPRAGLLVTVSAIFINIFCNWLLMFGNWGFPNLGVAGAGWATTCVNAWMLILLACFMFWDTSLCQKQVFFGFRWQLQGGVMWELLRIGTPIALTIMAEVWLFTGLTFLMGKLGTVPLAAHQVALNISTLTFMFALGIANASTVRVGQALGKGKPLQARQAGLTGMLLGMAVMSLSGLVFLLCPRVIIGLYLDLHDPLNGPVIELITLLLRLAAVFQLFDALQVTSQGALRGLKDTLMPMLISFICYWILGLGAALVLGFGLQHGAPGLWGGLILGLFTASLTLAARFFWHFRRSQSAQWGWQGPVLD